MTYDAVIVGSGPGGATAADVLSAAGWSVLIVEKGRNHLLDPTDLTAMASDYSNDEIKFQARYFLGPDPLIEPRTFRTGEDEGEHSHVGEVNSIPTTVGGGGTHADGKVPRFREEDFSLRDTYGPIDGASVEDWPIGYDELEPFYADVERAIGVAGDAGANPFAAWRSGPYPMAPGAPMYGRCCRRPPPNGWGCTPMRRPRRPIPFPTTAGRRATTAGSAHSSGARSMPRATPSPCCAVPSAPATSNWRQRPSALGW